MNKNEKTVSYWEFESALARMDRLNKRLWVTSLILIGALVGSNLYWIIWG